MNNMKDVVLDLNASYKVKHEKFENFSESYFADVYNQAAQIIKEIIESGKGDFASESYDGFTEPISNLIAFNGKRGSGKTSAMLSFCDFLKDFEKYRGMRAPSACKEMLEMQQRVSFTVLDSIDATLITKPNDLIGAILGKMLVAIKMKEEKDLQSGNPKNVEIRKLKSRLGAIYSSLEQDDIKNGAPGEVLEQLSRSWNQQEAFRKSVDKFNEHMIEYGDRKTQNYLVVPVDDVDMNLEGGYQLLEVIRKYLMSSNVIVFLAADYHQLGKLCMNAYKRALDRIEMPIEELALEYLEKLIPTGRRICMPELYQEEMLYSKKILIVNECGEKLPIKKVVLGKIWENIGLLLNINAEVNHWLLPHSLRKLSNYVNSMNYLINYDKDNDKNAIFNKNIQWFCNDLISRYLNEKELENGDYAKIISIIENFNKEVLESKIPKLVTRLIGEKYEILQPNTNWSDKIRYGTLLGQLYDKWKLQTDQTMVQAISFAVSLYLRTYIFTMENGNFINEEDDVFKEEFLKVTKGEFWGDLDQATINRVGKSSSRTLTMKHNFEILQKENLSGEELLIFAIQLGLTKEKEEKIKGTLRFGNFIDIIFDYRKRITDIADLLKTLECFQQKEEEIQTACDGLIDEFDKWANRFKTTRVIPFDSIEFMFNVFDRLYGTEGAFEKLAEISQDSYGEMYVNAINDIEKLLEQYDEYYADVRKKYCINYGSERENIPVELDHTYSEVYKECPFIKYMQNDKKIEERKRIFSAFLAFFGIIDVSQKENLEPKENSNCVPASTNAVENEIENVQANNEGTQITVGSENGRDGDEGE